MLDFGIDKYGLNAWIFDCTNDGTTNYDKVLFSADQGAADAVGILRKGEWADVKVKIVGGALEGSTAGMLVKVEELTATSRASALPHLGLPRDRDLADVAGRARLHRRLCRVPRVYVPDVDRRRLRGPRGRRHREETYVEQGRTGRPATSRCSSTSSNPYDPDLRLVGMPTTDEFQHQFLGLSRRCCRMASRPGLRRRRPERRHGPPRRRPRGIHPLGVPGSGRGPDAGPQAVGKDPTTFVSSDYGFAPQFLAIDASKPLVDPGPALAAADVELPPGHRRDYRQGEGLLGRRRAPDLPQRRRPRPGGRRFEQVAAADVAATVAAIKARTSA